MTMKDENCDESVKNNFQDSTNNENNEKKMDLEEKYEVKENEEGDTQALNEKIDKSNVSEKETNFEVSNKSESCLEDNFMPATKNQEVTSVIDEILLKPEVTIIKKSNSNGNNEEIQATEENHDEENIQRSNNISNSAGESSNNLNVQNQNNCTTAQRRNGRRIPSNSQQNPNTPARSFTYLIPENEYCTLRNNCSCITCNEVSSSSTIGSYTGHVPNLSPDFLNNLPIDLLEAEVRNYYEELRRSNSSYTPISLNFLNELNDVARGMFEQEEVKLHEDYVFNDNDDIKYGDNDMSDFSDNFDNWKPIFDISRAYDCLMVVFRNDSKHAIKFLSNCCRNDLFRSKVFEIIFNTMRKNLRRIRLKLKTFHSQNKHKFLKYNHNEGKYCFFDINYCLLCNERENLESNYYDKNFLQDHCDSSEDEICEVCSTNECKNHLCSNKNDKQLATESDCLRNQRNEFRNGSIKSKAANDNSIQYYLNYRSEDDDLWLCKNKFCVFSCPYKVKINYLQNSKYKTQELHTADDLITSISHSNLDKKEQVNSNHCECVFTDNSANFDFENNATYQAKSVEELKERLERVKLEYKKFSNPNLLKFFLAPTSEQLRMCSYDFYNKNIYDSYSSKDKDITEFKKNDNLDLKEGKIQSLCNSSINCNVYSSLDEFSDYVNIPPDSFYDGFAKIATKRQGSLSNQMINKLIYILDYVSRSNSDFIRNLDLLQTNLLLHCLNNQTILLYSPFFENFFDIFDKHDKILQKLCDSKQCFPFDIKIVNEKDINIEKCENEVIYDYERHVLKVYSKFKDNKCNLMEKENFSFNNIQEDLNCTACNLEKIQHRLILEDEQDNMNKDTTILDKNLENDMNIDEKNSFNDDSIDLMVLNGKKRSLNDDVYEFGTYKVPKDPDSQSSNTNSNASLNEDCGNSKGFSNEKITVDSSLQNNINHMSNFQSSNTDELNIASRNTFQSDLNQSNEVITNQIINTKKNDEKEEVETNTQENKNIKDVDSLLESKNNLFTGDQILVHVAENKLSNSCINNLKSVEKILLDEIFVKSEQIEKDDLDNKQTIDSNDCRNYLTDSREKDDKKNKNIYTVFVDDKKLQYKYFEIQLGNTADKKSPKEIYLLKKVINKRSDANEDNHLSRLAIYNTNNIFASFLCLDNLFNSVLTYFHNKNVNFFLFTIKFTKTCFLPQYINFFFDEIMKIESLLIADMKKNYSWNDDRSQTNGKSCELKLYKSNENKITLDEIEKSEKAKKQKINEENRFKKSYKKRSIKISYALQKKLFFSLEALACLRLDFDLSDCPLYLLENYMLFNKKRSLVENSAMWTILNDIMPEDISIENINLITDMLKSFCILRSLRLKQKQYKDIFTNKNAAINNNFVENKTENNHETCVNQNLFSIKNINSCETGFNTKKNEITHDKENNKNIYNPIKADIIVSSAENHKFNKLFNHFVTKNHKCFNAIVDRDIGLLQSNFAVLLNYNIFDFNIKRKYLKDVKNKNAVFHKMLFIKVDRSKIFEDSYSAIMNQSPANLERSKLSIKFKEEEGVDGGGLTREFYQCLSKEIVNPDYCLFVLNSDNITYSINKSSYVNPEHLLYFRFVGRIIAKGIIDENYFDIHFTKSFYKQILGKEPDFNDLESFDENFYRSMKWLKNNSIQNIVELYFCEEYEEFGERKTFNLIENGDKIMVTDHNKDLYISLISKFKMISGCEKQTEAFVQGFREILDQKLVNLFDEKELELLISGCPDLDVDDWRNNTAYHGYKSNDKEIQWFWRAVRSFTNENKAKLLQFVTGTSKLPIDGFSALRGSNDLEKFQIHLAHTGKLPSAHTCSNQLDLPKYDSYEELRKYLLYAITECSTGFAFV
ncbi:hypothetical protein EDEG_01698 [Edhazardia aedis USNM 41457]|uniref:HECT-type E3 ubiquitin transferase n=1 Tax=Edhazardia aedis (strain USNM 41457) TaxID=1003232 RepID=J9DNA1_EDHAE|nr:hypothetical protein EDEG_01698 [Edhazardia aedis USNM 41457]|eukprot:EJW04015.1 hypothetical protein EDEG_01698 [Edhazardia aedis USNM 41457]